MNVLFGRHGGWQEHLPVFLDGGLYRAAFGDFATFDLDLVDYAVPVSLEDVQALRQRYGDRSGKYLIPDAATLALCADKKRLNERVLTSPYAHMIPPMYAAGACIFPYVLKRRDRLSGVDVFMIGDAAAAAAHAAELANGDYFAQAYVPGREEFSTHLLLRDGRVIYQSSNRYLMAEEFTVKGNAAKPVREWFGIAPGAKVLADLVGLMEMLGFNGICCLDYKIAAGQVQLLETNPRCGNSLFRDINNLLAAYTGSLGGPAGD